MDNTHHTEDCIWAIRTIKKTKQWYLFMNIKHCPTCNAPVEVTNEA